MQPIISATKILVILPRNLNLVAEKTEAFSFKFLRDNPVSTAAYIPH